MSRYTYSKDKTVRATKTGRCFWSIEKDEIDYGKCWGAPKFYQCGTINAPTLRGLLDKIAGEK